MKFLYLIFIMCMIGFAITNPAFITLIIVVSVIASLIFALCFLSLASKKETTQSDYDKIINTANNVVIKISGIPDYEEDDFLFEFEDKYADTAGNKLDKYEEICSEIENMFYDVFNINQRIKIIKKALKTFDDYKDYCYSKGHGGEVYFNNNAEIYIDKNYIFTPKERNIQDDYTPEYEEANFTNINFLKNLLDEYENNTDISKKHLHEEEIFYYGGREEYDYMLSVKNLRKNVLKTLKKNDGILQTEFYKLFNTRLKSDLMGELAALSSEGLINRQKHGSTYKLTLPKTFGSDKADQ